MPRGDGTGPLGMGPMTGRGMGVCGTSNANYYGCGRGLGLGARRGFRRFYNMPEVDTKASLQNRAEYLKRSLDDVQRQLDNYKDDE